MSSAKFSIGKFVLEMLSARPGERFSARQIAEWIFATYPAACAEKRARSTARATPLDTDQALIQQIIAEIGAQRENIQAKTPQIETTEERPRKYFFSITDSRQVTVEIPAEHSLPIEGIINRSEYDLYPALSAYLTSELNVHSRRIDERRAKNSRGRGGNNWLFPDIVGIVDLSEKWHREVRDTVRQAGDRRSKLWSFEVKLSLNGANVRQSFFQAVSNSSWANQGYLVAADITGESTLGELRMLSALHGIGVILLDPENPAESQILIPCREKSEVDWDTANRIADENEDFVEFVRLVRHFHQTGDLRSRDWA